MRFPGLIADNLFWGSLAEIAANSVIVVFSLFLWAGICYLFLRFSRREDGQRMQEFLQFHYYRFIQASSRDSQSKVTELTIRRAGSIGWIFAVLPVLCGFSFHWNLIFVLLAISFPLFGGLLFACSWYGIRCLRKLNLDYY